MTWKEIAGSAKILIVDDESANVRLLERILERAGFTHIESTQDPREAVPLVLRFGPDLILLDLRMPHMDGYEVMERLAALLPTDTYLPILVLTAVATPVAEEKALSLGAKDFVSKPFRRTEVLLRINNLLETRFLHLRLQQHNALLEQRVKERTRELEAARLEVLERLTQAAEFRDDATGHHTRRVGELSARMAQALGLPEDQVELIRRAAPLHDAGKIAIPDAILLKPDRLTPEEFEVMKTHTTIGARMLAGGDTDVMAAAERIALSHHERWDGRGYPEGRSGEAIPLEARIVAVADFFDALAHDRPYRAAWPRDRIVEEIARERGRHFDPEMVRAFLSFH